MNFNVTRSTKSSRTGKTTIKKIQSFVRSAKTGANSVKYSGRYRDAKLVKRVLKPGRYTLNGDARRRRWKRRHQAHHQIHDHQVGVEPRFERLDLVAKFSGALEVQLLGLAEHLFFERGDLVVQLVRRQSLAISASTRPWRPCLAGSFEPWVMKSLMSPTRLATVVGVMPCSSL